jgi:selenide,water dikinase
VPKFGMCVTGVVDPARALRNDQARPRQRLWLSKPLGTGIVVTAAKADSAPERALAAAVDAMRRLNRDASEEALRAGAACATDVTGFGLVGHLAHMVRASGVTAVVETARLPVLPDVPELAEAGHTTGGARRNGEFAEPLAELPPAGWARELVLDPQTSGGLLVACEAEPAGFVEVGWMEPGPPRIRFV